MAKVKKHAKHKKHVVPADLGPIDTESSMQPHVSVIEHRSRAVPLSLAIIGLLLVVVVGVAWVSGGLGKIGNSSVTHSADRAAEQLDLAKRALDDGRKEAAYTYAQKALEFDPNNSEAAYVAATVGEQLGKPETQMLYKNALKLQEKKTNSNPGSFPPAAYARLADLALKAGDNEAAKKYYQRTIDAAKKYGSDEEALGYAKLAREALEKL